MSAPSRPHERATEMIKGKVTEVDQCAHCLTTYPCDHLKQQARISELEGALNSAIIFIAGSVDEPTDETSRTVTALKDVLGRSPS